MEILLILSLAIMVEQIPVEAEYLSGFTARGTSVQTLCKIGQETKKLQKIGNDVIVTSFLKIAQQFFVSETSYLPLTLQCDPQMGYIDVGGITLNARNMDTVLQKQAQSECDKQMKNLQQVSSPGRAFSACQITFGRTFSLNSSDVLRAVYKCYYSKPHGAPNWVKPAEDGMGPTQTAEQRPHETKVNLQCAADKAIIVQKNIYLDGNPLEESGITPDPTWTKDGMENECFKQKVEQLKSNIKKAVECTISNTKTGKLKIEYSCLMPVSS